MSIDPFKQISVVVRNVEFPAGLPMMTLPSWTLERSNVSFSIISSRFYENVLECRRGFSNRKFVDMIFL